LTRAVDWTRRTLQAEYRENRELADLLEGDSQGLLNLWTELSLASEYRWSAPPDVSQHRQVAELCLTRLVSALRRQDLAVTDAQAEDDVFSFAATLAEYGTRERIHLDDLLQYLLLLRRAIHLQLRKYGSVTPHFTYAVDRFFDMAVIAFTRRWTSANRATVQWEESQLTGLLTVSHEMLSTLDPTAASNALVRQAQELAEADGAVLLALDPTGERWELAAATTLSPAVRPVAPLPLQQSVSGEALRTGQTVTNLDERIQGQLSALRGSAQVPAEPASVMSAPVRLGGRIAGALEVANFEPRLYTPDQIKMLGMLAAQAGLVWENAARHRQSLDEERGRTLREIRTAQKVQRGLLSENHVQHGVLSIGACLEPSREVGGDYYDFFPTGSDRRLLALHIGDVSGKGVPAALLVAMSKYVLRSHALPEVPPPGHVLREMNATFCTDLSDEMGMFVTACYAHVDDEGHELRYASAGHPAPLIIRGSLMQPVEDRSPAPPIGLVPGQLFPERRVALYKGDLVILYTDGVVEARSASGECFGLTGLRRALRECRDMEPVDLTRFLVEAVRSFQAGRPLSDDTTVVALKVGG
jgi:serine phosphatase RsbU (regulator of sigma subunit)